MNDYIYIIKEDSAHTGKQCVIVNSLNDNFKQKIFDTNPSLNSVTFSFDDEVYIYEKITKKEIENREQELKDNWNLGNSYDLEDTCYEHLIDKYKINWMTCLRYYK